MASRRSGIRRLSKKRAEELKVYAKERRAYLKRHPLCLSCVLRKMAPQKACDIHHRRGRAGEMLLRQEWWIPVCRQCHHWIGNNIRLAQSLDLIAGWGEWLKKEA